MPNNVGHDVPTTGSEASVVGLTVAVDVATAHVQSDSVKHCVFLQFPVVDPLGM